MDVALKQVHIGTEIKKQFNKLNITKTEFGNRINVRQQHVNRIFDMASINTAQLADISLALDFNFFTCYIEPTNNINADRSAISTGDGGAMVFIGDEALASKLKVLEVELANAQKEAKMLAAQLEDKQEIINLLRDKLKGQDS